MARTPSNMVALGTLAPDFLLPDTNSNEWKSLDDVKGSRGTLIVFLCNHCPYVLHVIDEVVRISNDYRVLGIGFAAISSNDVTEYPEDAPDKMSEFAFHNKFSFPYLYDEFQETARQYDAACTPDFYLFDSQNRLVYRGQLDDSRPQNGITSNGTDLRNALDALVYNRKINPEQKPSLGCNIKWKKSL